jgi:hypothetical protein
MFLFFLLLLIEHQQNLNVIQTYIALGGTLFPADGSQPGGLMFGQSPRHPSLI